MWNFCYPFSTGICGEEPQEGSTIGTYLGGFRVHSLRCRGSLLAWKSVSRIVPWGSSSRFDLVTHTHPTSNPSSLSCCPLGYCERPRIWLFRPLSTPTPSLTHSHHPLLTAYLDTYTPTHPPIHSSIHWRCIYWAFAICQWVVNRETSCLLSWNWHALGGRRVVNK